MKSETAVRAASDLNDKDEPIYQALMNAIVEHQLPPGSKLPEEALSAVFGISRTGIRKVLQRLAAVQMITLTPKRGAQVAMPSVDEAKDIFSTRSLLECANLSAVLVHLQPPHLAALESLTQQEQRAHDTHDGPAAFHIQLQAISGNQVLTEMVTRLSQRSSLVIAAYGAPWQHGCRCHDHERLIELLRQKSLSQLTDALQQHFAYIVATLHFARSGEALPDFEQIFTRQGGWK